MPVGTVVNAYQNAVAPTYMRWLISRPKAWQGNGPPSLNLQCSAAAITFVISRLAIGQNVHAATKP